MREATILDRARSLRRRRFRSSANELRQGSNRARAAEPVVEELPEGDPQLPAGLLQTREGISTAAPELAAGAPADLALLDVLADVPLTGVVVQRDVGPVEHQQQLRLVVVQPLERLVQRREAGPGGE